jgi:hypothetical protein
MVHISGGGVDYIECDYCKRKFDTTDQYFQGAPENWYYIALGKGHHLESASSVWHFCCKGCLVNFSINSLSGELETDA